MSTTAMDLERITLEGLRKDFEAKGYRFVSEPAKDDTPDFLGGYSPDAVAFGDRDRVIIEIKGSNSRKNKIPLAELARKIPENAGWRYLLVYAGQDPSEIVDLSRASKQQVDRAIKEAHELVRAGHNRAAVLEVWAILEALARRIDRESIMVSLKPLSSTQIVERLAMEGALEAADSKRLRSLSSLRNSVAHGDLDARISGEDVTYMLALAETINSQAVSD